MKDEQQCSPPEGHGKKMFLSMLLLVIIALGGFYVLGNQFTNQKGDTIYVSSQPTEHGISVSGEAKTKIAPNQGQISFEVITNDSRSAKTAQDDNAESSAQVVAALKSAGLTDDDIQSTSFSVQPIYSSRYVCPDEAKTCDSYDRIYKSEIIGYRAVHSYLVSFDDTKKAGIYVDKISSTENNAVTIDSISFVLKAVTRAEVEKQLLTDAAKDAKDKAQKIAAGFGSSVGKVLSASESVVYPSYYGRNYLTESMVGAAMDKSAPETVIYPTSDIEVSASVNAMFEVN
ncbi:MAG: SIMPL domain-containing protein [Candidatus Micrarchaeota archaeon]|nr:SIMPL domain-containing protein [Candidatus Micrarchaeota archaeon]